MGERLGKPEATWTEDFHRYVWAERGVSMTLERFHEESKDIRCELSVESAHNTRGGLLHFGHLLLIGPRSKADALKQLAARDPQVDWDDALDQARGASLHRLRKGEPVIDLGTAELQAPAAFLIKPLLLDRGVTTWFGDGGSGKSVLALAACLSLASGESVMGIQPSRRTPALYLDWEDDADAHVERLRALAAYRGVAAEGVYYQRQIGAIKDRVRELRRSIAELGAGFAVIDSAGMAGVDPDSATEMVAVYNAARALGIPVLVIHHIAKDAKDKTKPYGSVYAHNASRYSVRVDSVREGSVTHVAMEPQKTNRTAGQRTLGYDIVFMNEGERLKEIDLQLLDVRTMPAFRDDKTPLWERIRDLLKSGDRMLSASDIAQQLGTTDANVRRALNDRKDSDFVKVGQSWAVLTKREEVPW